MRKDLNDYYRKEFKLYSGSNQLGENIFNRSTVGVQCVDNINFLVMMYESFDRTIGPYFIIYNGGEYIDDASCCCRISCLEPKYIIANDSRLKHFNLNKNEIDWLMNYLSFKYEPNSTIWERIIYTYHNLNEIHGPIDYNKYPIPDYYKLLDDIHPDYLSIFNKKKRR